jgi:hypothetical protein
MRYSIARIFLLSAIPAHSERPTASMTASFDALADLTVSTFAKECFFHGTAPVMEDAVKLVAALERIGNEVPEFCELDQPTRTRIAADFTATIREKLANWLVSCGKVPQTLQ